MSEYEPTCLGILLCDQVIEDKRTNKKSLIGVFNDIMIAGAPAKHPLMYIMLSLTGCRREHLLELELSRDTDQGCERILGLKGRVTGKNPVDVIDLVFELHGVPLPGFGQFTVDVTSNPDGRRLAQRSFFVRPIPKTKKPGAGHQHPSGD